MKEPIAMGRGIHVLGNLQSFHLFFAFLASATVFVRRKKVRSENLMGKVLAKVRRPSNHPSAVIQMMCHCKLDHGAQFPRVT